MKSIRAMLLPIFLAGIGCVTLPSLKDEPAPKAAPAERPVANAPSSGAHQEIALPPVNPDEVTDANAGEKAEALRRELSRENK
jgi:hypothetical protein